MDRRAFAASLVLTPFAWSCARPPAKIGVFVPGGSTAQVLQGPTLAALIQGMQDLGYVQGRDYVVEVRGAEGNAARYDAVAAELVATKPNVIIAPDPVLPALRRQTSTIPIVMAAASDPVAQGYAQSLARPGGNLTGLSVQFTDLAGKWLELLRAVARGPGPVAVLTESGGSILKAIQDAAGASKWDVVPLEVRMFTEVEPALAAASGAAALVVVPSGLIDAHMREVAEIAARHRLPAMYGFRRFVEAGGLMSYSPDIVAIWRRAAWFVDRILKGTKPGELAIEQPVKFDLVINLKAARAAGREVPASLRQRADTVI
ncbi:MAG: ABC transporter substrate-binding protein [Burkholderiales bacterium]|nr:ABC transporter substrate-binding protein [Burkholderiales bacterium]